MSYSVVFMKNINLLRLRCWRFLVKFMDLSEAATAVLWKKLFLKILNFHRKIADLIIKKRPIKKRPKKRL